MVFLFSTSSAALKTSLVSHTESIPSFMMVILTALVQFQETLSRLFLQDFENKHGFGINDWKSMKPILFLLFTLDFWLCHIVIGESVNQMKGKIILVCQKQYF